MINKLIGLIIVLLLFFSTNGLKKLYESSKYQIILLTDFNRTQNFSRPLTIINQIPDEFPSLGVTLIPIKAAKSIYYIKQDSLLKAKRLLIKSINDNPYLGINETLLSEVYLKEKKYDSALYFSKKAIDKNYRNTRHLLNAQKNYFATKSFDKADSLLLKYKDKLYAEIAVEMFYQNHFALLATNKNEFSTSDSLLSQEALKRFPNNKIIKNTNQVIVYGYNVVALVNDLDTKANNFFETKQYAEAVELWEQALQIKSDDAYFLNIIKALVILDEKQKTQRYFNQFENSGLNEKNGEYEYLKALYYQKQDSISKACQYFRMSFEYGYKVAESFIDYNKC